MDDVEALLSVKDSVDSLLSVEDSVEALPASVYVPDSIVEVQPAVEDSIYVEVSASGEAPQEVPVSVVEVPDSSRAGSVLAAARCTPAASSQKLASMHDAMLAGVHVVDSCTKTMTYQHRCCMTR